jgi:hypothetical protein
VLPKSTLLAASVAGVATPILNPDAGATYTSAEQDLINEIKAAFNVNNALWTEVLNGLNQNSAVIIELQRLLGSLAGMASNMAATRDVDVFRTPTTLTDPDLAAGDFPSFLSSSVGKIRNNSAETTLTPDNVDQLAIDWSTPPGPPLVSVPTVADDIVYYGDITGLLSAVKSGSGSFETLWEFKCDGPLASSPTVTKDVVVMYDLFGNVYGLGRADGSFLWKVRPNLHPMAGFFGGQGIVDEARGLIYVGVPSNQEDAMAMNNEKESSGTGDSLSAPDGDGIQTLTDAGASFTTDEMHREITISKATDPDNNVRKVRITNAPTSNTLEFLNPDGSAVTEAFEWAITSPFARQIFDLPNDPPKKFEYKLGGSFIPSIHAIEIATGKVRWSHFTVNEADGDFTADAPGSSVDGGTVIANLPGSIFGYPPGVPSNNGYNVYSPAALAHDIFGTDRYNFGPSGGGVWGAITHDLDDDVLFVPTGEQMAPPAVPTANAVIALNASDGTRKWATQLVVGDIWDHGLRSRGPDLKTGTVNSLSAPDADGFQTLTDAGTPFVAVDGAGGKVFELSGMANSENDGDFGAAEFVDTSTVKILNPDGVAEGSGGSYAVNQVHNTDIGDTPKIVITQDLTKYVVVGGKDGRLYVLNPSTGALVKQKQLIQPGSLGGWQTGSAQDGDVVYMGGGNTINLGKSGTELTNLELDADEPGPGVVGAYRIENDGSVTRIWEKEIVSSVSTTISVGPRKGEVFTGNIVTGVTLANGVVYLWSAGGDQSLRCYRATDGELLASVPLGVFTISIPTVSRGKVYCVAGGSYSVVLRPPVDFAQPFGKLFCLSLPSGT